MGLILGMNFFLVPFFPFGFQPDHSGNDPGDKGDTQVNKDAFGNLADGDVHHRAFQPEPTGQDGDENIGIDREEKDLENGVKGHQSGAVFRVPRGQFVPDDDHGNTAGQADHDQTHHVFRVAGQKKDGQKKHQDGTDDPVLDQGKEQDPVIFKDFAQFLVLDLGQRGIHHQDQTDGNGDIGGPGLEEVPELGHPGKKYPEPTPTSMARKIQRVKKRSRKESFLGSPHPLKFSSLLVIIPSPGGSSSGSVFGTGPFLNFYRGGSLWVRIL